MLSIAILALATSLSTLPDAGAMDDWYPPAQGELVIEVPENVQRSSDFTSMYDLAQQYGALTGQHMSISDETAQLLQGQSTGLHSSIRVPAERVQRVFESILLEQAFVMRVVHENEPRIFSLESLRTQARNTIRGDSRFVPSSAVELMRRHPATMVTTTLHLPHTDVRQLSNSLRTLITDANTQQILPAGNTDTLVLVGFGYQVAGLIDMLKLVDEASAQMPKPKPEPAAGAAK